MSGSQEEEVSQSVSGGGVILKPSSRSRCWTLTVNNPTNAIKAQVDSLVSTSEKWILGNEVGDSGTPHIQGYIRFKNQIRFSTLKKKVPTAHWEKAKGTPDQNFRYCSKEGNYRSNFELKLSREEIKDLVRKKYMDVLWRPWQRDVIDVLDACSSERTIYWIYEANGNTGKTFLSKYLALRKGTIVCSGKANDIFNQVNNTIESGTVPKLVLVDIPRVSLDYVSYMAIECLKNGMLYSGKYEGGTCIFPSPTVVCFANEMPKICKLSKDRWQIYIIKDETLYEKLF